MIQVHAQGQASSGAPPYAQSYYPGGSTLPFDYVMSDGQLFQGGTFAAGSYDVILVEDSNADGVIDAYQDDTTEPDGGLTWTVSSGAAATGVDFSL